MKWLTRIEVRDRALPGALHGARLRHHPRGGAGRGDRLDLHLGRARPAQVGAGEGDQAGRRLPDHGRRLGRADRRGRGAHRRRALAARDADRPARARRSPGSSGPSIGARPTPASTRSPRARPPWTARSSRRRTTRSWPARRPSGRATARSPGASASPDPFEASAATPRRSLRFRRCARQAPRARSKHGAAHAASPCSR